MTQFYQPYQFVPVKSVKQDANAPKNLKDIRAEDALHSVRHDLWKAANSGKIICSLTLETPMVLGLQHQKIQGSPPNTIVLPEKRNFADSSHYYIPANSLKGMISSIAEAITQSSLRVLENTRLKISLGRDKSNHLGYLHDYFEAIDSDVLPLGAPLRADPKLSSAELMFGCIENQQKHTQDTAIALASRIRFSDAKLSIAEEQPLMPEIILKALSTPKTNSHNMYYHPKGQRGEYIAKGELDRLYHHPNGRKFYLHATAAMVENQSWKVNGRPDKPNIHVKCRPFKAQQSFTFHIDFENLSDNELGVLLTSLRPDKDFRHKLGMGKPLGLGTVRLDIQGVYLINRQKRYGRKAFEQNRYEKIYMDSDSQLDNQPDKQLTTVWQNNYPQETTALDTLDAEPAPKQSDLIDPDSLKILKRIGQWPIKPQSYDVDYPYVINTKGEKQAGYAWYVKNDKAGGGQALKPVDPDLPLPTLKTYQVE